MVRHFAATNVFFLSKGGGEEGGKRGKREEESADATIKSRAQ